jgi:hypothetical protein
MPAIVVVTRPAMHHYVAQHPVVSMVRIMGGDPMARRQIVMIEAASVVIHKTYASMVAEPDMAAIVPGQSETVRPETDECAAQVIGLRG